jgi:Mg-chelatase subunit ChlD
VPVLEMDSHGQRQAELGTFRFQAISGRTGRSPIKVDFSIDAAKTVVLKAIDVTTGQELPGERVTYEEPKVVEVPGGGGPVTVVLAVDCSISMFGSKIDQARNSAKEIARKYVSEDGSRKVALVNFGGPHHIYPAKVLVAPTNSIGQIESAADGLQAGGGTPMEAGMERIRDVLEPAQGKRVAIILTDGMPNDPEKTRQLSQTLRSLGITIGTVPIGTDADQNFLRAIGDLESNLKVDNAGQGMTAAVMDILSKV